MGQPSQRSSYEEVLKLASRKSSQLPDHCPTNLSQALGVQDDPEECLIEEMVNLYYRRKLFDNENFLNKQAVKRYNVDNN